MIKKILLVFFIPISIYSQIQECGTVASQAQIDYLTQTRGPRQSWNQAESIIWLPVQHHIVRESNGSSGLDTTSLQGIMDTLNTYY